MGVHAKLGPSSAERWFNCPGSIAASVGIPNQSGVFAAEGTAAHSLAAYCLEHGFDAARFIGAVAGPDGVNDDVAAIADDETTFEVDEEMADAVQTYLDLCRQFMLAPWEYDIEQRLDLTAVHKDVFGTGDFISYHPETKALIVVDYKHGKGHAVEVDANKQLMTYAVGAALRYHNRGLGSITLYVVQPRCPHKNGPIREANYDSVELLEFRSDLADAALATEAPDARRVAGEWCYFCPAAATCVERRNLAMSAAESEFGEVVGMSPDKVAEVLRQADQMKNWIKRVEAFAQTEAQHGRLPTGFKLVAKRATRKWKNSEDARTYLLSVLELDEAQIFGDPKMKSPAQIEAVIGKKRKKEIDGLYEAISSGANLVPEEDDRPPLKPDAEAEFA
jgi:hypothetical protein